MRAKSPWNKGKKPGPKKPLSRDQVNLVRMRLEQSENLRDLSLFCLAYDTAFRGVDLVQMRVSGVMSGGEMLDTVRITQQKSRRRNNPTAAKEAVGTVSPRTQQYLQSYINKSGKGWNDYLFTRQKGDTTKPIGPHQYREILKGWIGLAGINPALYGSHSLRRTKTTMIYKQTGNLRACQKLLGHSSIQNTATYLGIEEAEALDISRNFDL